MTAVPPSPPPNPRARAPRPAPTPPVPPVPRGPGLPSLPACSPASPCAKCSAPRWPEGQLYITSTSYGMIMWRWCDIDTIANQQSQFAASVEAHMVTPQRGRLQLVSCLCSGSNTLPAILWSRTQLCDPFCILVYLSARPAQCLVECTLSVTSILVHTSHAGPSLLSFPFFFSHLLSEQGRAQ